MRDLDLFKVECGEPQLFSFSLTLRAASGPGLARTMRTLPAHPLWRAKTLEEMFPVRELRLGVVALKGKGASEYLDLGTSTEL